MFDSMSQVARAISVNHQTINTHQGKGGFPTKTKSGKWNARKVYEYFVNYNAVTMAKPSKKVAANKEEAHTRLLSAKAESAEIDLAIRRKEAYESKSVKAAFMEIGSVVSSELNVFDSRVANRLSLSGEQQRTLRTEVEDIAARVNAKCLEQIDILDMDGE